MTLIFKSRHFKRTLLVILLIGGMWYLFATRSQDAKRAEVRRDGPLTLQDRMQEILAAREWLAENSVKMGFNSPGTDPYSPNRLFNNGPPPRSVYQFSSSSSGGAGGRSAWNPMSFAGGRGDLDRYHHDDNIQDVPSRGGWEIQQKGWGGGGSIQDRVRVAQTMNMNRAPPGGDGSVYNQVQQDGPVPFNGNNNARYRMHTHAYENQLLNSPFHNLPPANPVGFQTLNQQNTNFQPVLPRVPNPPDSNQFVLKANVVPNPMVPQPDPTGILFPKAHPTFNVVPNRDVKNSHSSDFLQDYAGDIVTEMTSMPETNDGEPIVEDTGAVVEGVNTEEQNHKAEKVQQLNHTDQITATPLQPVPGRLQAHHSQASSSAGATNARGNNPEDNVGVLAPREITPHKDNTEPPPLLAGQAAEKAQTQDNHHQPQSDHHQPQSDHHQPQSDHHQPQSDHHQPQSDHHQPQSDHHQPQSDHHQPQSDHHQPQSDQQPENPQNTLQSQKSNFVPQQNPNVPPQNPYYPQTNSLQDQASQLQDVMIPPMKTPPPSIQLAAEPSAANAESHNFVRRFLARIFSDNEKIAEDVAGDQNEPDSNVLPQSMEQAPGMNARMEQGGEVSSGLGPAVPDTDGQVVNLPPGLSREAYGFFNDGGILSPAQSRLLLQPGPPRVSGPSLVASGPVPLVVDSVKGGVQARGMEPVVVPPADGFQQARDQGVEKERAGESGGGEERSQVKKSATSPGDLRFVPMVTRDKTHWKEEACPPMEGLRATTLRTPLGGVSLYTEAGSNDTDDDVNKAFGLDWNMHGVGTLFDRCFLAGDNISLVDIGSGIGAVPLTASRLASEVYAIEPVDKLVYALCNSAKDMHYDNVHVIHNAVSDDRGKVSFRKETNSESDPTHMVDTRSKSKVDPNSPTAFAIKLDDILRLYKITKAVVKMDVESFEGRALAGANKFLNTVDIPCILMEWKHVHALKEFGGNHVFDILSNHGFFPHDVNTLLPLKVFRMHEWPQEVLWAKIGSSPVKL